MMQLGLTSDVPVYVPFVNVGVGHGGAIGLPPRVLLFLFCVESTLVGYLCFSAVLILVVKIFGKGGMSNRLWKALVLEMTFPSWKTS